MISNEQYQKNIRLIGKALPYLNACNFKDTELATPYRQLVKARQQWFIDRKRSVRKNYRQVIEMYDSCQYSPEAIADKLGMDYGDVGDIIISKNVLPQRLDFLINNMRG